jgi:hypothetical protein
MRFFALTLLLLTSFSPLIAQQPTTWRFDSLTSIGGVQPTILGTPKVVPTNIGKAIHFHGNATSGDALFIPTNPLADTIPYTFEVIFRPSHEGVAEQRFFHIQELNQEQDSESRRMFELRIHGDKWCLDTVAVNTVPGQPARSGIMLNCDEQHLFPLDRWYAIAAVYDGKILRSYVNGILQGETPVALLPLGPSGTSVGTRYTKRDYFTGDIFSARFTPRALPLDQLLHAPAELVPVHRP